LKKGISSRAIVIAKSNNVKKEEKRKNHILRRQFDDKRYVEREPHGTKKNTASPQAPIDGKGKVADVLAVRQNDVYPYVHCTCGDYGFIPFDCSYGTVIFALPPLGAI
jgi:hypothetical protein